MPSRDYTYKTFDSSRHILATVSFESPALLSLQDREPKPIALHLHGGGYSSGSRSIKENQNPQISYLARHNFVVASVDHRLCPNISLADGPVADTRDAYNWCREGLPRLLKRDFGLDVDGKRVVVFGQSSGAHLGMLLGLQEPRPRAILSFYGPLYLGDEWWSKRVDLPVPDFDQAFLDAVFDEPVLTNSAQQDPNRPKHESGTDARMAWLSTRMKTGTLVSTLMGADLKGLDPAAGFDKDFPPTFFAHGLRDNLVHISLANRAHGELERLGVTSGLAVWEEGGHGFDVAIEHGGPGWDEVVRKGLDFLVANA